MGLLEEDETRGRMRRPASSPRGGFFHRMTQKSCWGLLLLLSSPSSHRHPAALVLAGPHRVFLSKSGTVRTAPSGEEEDRLPVGQVVATSDLLRVLARSRKQPFLRSKGPPIIEDFWTRLCGTVADLKEKKMPQKYWAAVCAEVVAAQNLKEGVGSRASS
mmetsp:Transcript_4348/g.10631  ORF Transcript_4348/g.10631 Transcript_4348/m.10631 type:complete len:160 (+) Transcript_4348:82-561(+)